MKGMELELKEEKKERNKGFNSFIENICGWESKEETILGTNCGQNQVEIEFFEGEILVFGKKNMSNKSCVHNITSILFVFL